MELAKAREIADGVVKKLAPFCQRIEIAGSIRRQRPFVHDIDLVLIPSHQGQLLAALQSLGKITMGGQKLIRVDLPGIMLDIYVAEPRTWATLLLIRTGSKAHNIRLCARAKSKGMVLHADGSGLYALTDCEGNVSRIAGDTEESIFAELGLPYLPPEKRE